MMDSLKKRGDVVAGKQLAQTKSEIKSALEEELPGDAQILETVEGVVVEADGLREQLLENSSLRDVAFLMRAAR
ncbi:MAG: hypothetical protein ABJF89_05695 [Parasphingorhabdus sp.]|uniref:hypothetical protein n=1 Tax=Parasphingorhabdus sp. TaxID=2709688 RepID=UPI0032679BAF